MIDMKLLHISWAIADNEARKACDRFFLDVFGAQTGFEMLMSEDTVGMGMGREESLMVIGDTMLIPIAAAGGGTGADAGMARKLHYHARYGMWIGIALQVKDLLAARAWCESLGLQPKFQAGLEDRFFLLSRSATLGLAFEIMTGDVPNDPRLAPDFDRAWWRDSHPLGIEGLQSIGLSVESLEKAREVFAGRFGFPEVSSRRLDDEPADCTSFLIGGALVEAMRPAREDCVLAQHAREIGGLYCLTFKVKSADAAARYLRGKGLRLTGDPSRRFMIDPDQAFSRRIFFTADSVAGDPRPGL